MSMFDSLFDTLIPASIHRDAAALTRAKNLVGLAVVAFGAAPGFAGLYWWLGNHFGAIAIGLVLPMLCVSLGSIRVLESLRFAQYSTMATLLALFSSLIWSMHGEVSNPVNAWFVAVPVVATFMLGLRQGLLWLGITLGTMLFFVWASQTGAIDFPADPVTNPELLHIISNLGLVPFVAGLALFFQLTKDQSDAVRLSQVDTIRYLMTEVGQQSAQVSNQVQQMVSSLSNQSEQAGAMRSASQANHELASVLEQTSTALALEADTARQTAQEGAEVIGSAITNSESLADAISQADQLVRTLQSRSRDISGIVDNIKSLAFQTNILALNATIEAAHAGVQGRGFAVVADNVRKLAGEAGDSASAISRELGVILGHIEQTAGLLDSSHMLAQEGRRSAGHAKSALQSIQDSVMTLHGEMSRLQDVSERQVRQNSEMQTVASAMEQGIQDVAGGSATIERAMTQLNARLTSVEV